jgi:glycosyltransferase involved in cell wall biosynthesis
MVVTHRAEFLDECLASVRSQTVAPSAVVLIDNASPGDEVRRIAAGHEVRTVRLDVPVGLGAARNVACEELRDCQLLVNVDGDDLIRPTFVDRYWSTARDRAADVVFGTAELFGTKTGVRFNRERLGARPDLRRTNHVPANSLWRWDLWQRAGGFHPTISHFEDWDLWLHFARFGARFEHVEEALWCYRRHPESKLTSTTREEKMAARQLVIDRHRRFIYGPLEWRRRWWWMADRVSRSGSRRAGRAARGGR